MASAPSSLPPGLMKAVLVAPDDDAPRLVAADWFAEHGQPERSDLITLQCQLARLSSCDPRHAELSTRLRVLGSKPPEVPGVELDEVRLSYARGFPQGVAGEVADLARAADAILAAAPGLDTLTVQKPGTPAQLDRLLESPLWPKLRTLELEFLDDRFATALFQSGALGALHTLCISQSRLDRSTWALLSEKAHLDRLHTLRLRFGNGNLWAHLGVGIPTLRALEFEHCGLVRDDLQRHATAAHWQTLESLALPMNSLASGGAAVIAQNEPTALRALDLSWCKVDAEGLAALARSRRLSLRTLQLRHNFLFGRALEPLLQAPCVAQVEWLDVRGNGADPKLLGTLRNRFQTALVA